MGKRWWILGGLAAHLLTSPIVAQRPPLGEVAVIGTGPTTLLVIPCASCRWRSFDEFAERHADRFTTVAVTLPGYGGSQLPSLPTFGVQPLWHEYALDALEGLLEERDLRDVIVVGHSFGSSLALQLAVRRPGRISGFVSLDATLAGPLERGSQSSAERVAAAQEVRRQYMEPLADPDAWQRFQLPSIGREDRRLLYHGWFMATDRTAVEQYWWDNLLTDRNPLLQQLAMPVLDVQLYSPGSRSATASRQRYQARVDSLELGDNYRVLYYENVRHFIMEDAPTLLDRIITEFANGTADYPAGVGG